MRKNDFVYLLVALLFLLIAPPVLLDFFELSEPIIRLFAYSVVLALGVWTLRYSTAWFFGGLILVTVNIVTNALALNVADETYSFATNILFFIFLVLITVSTGRQVLQRHSVTLNRIVGAICIYLLLGALWALLYQFIYVLDVGAFKTGVGAVSLEHLHEWVYFSFITLTTLGYGDIVPISSTARTIAFLEAIFGQFYIAILVAGLVGQYISRRED